MRILILLALSGCAILSGPFRESRTDAILAPYLRDLVYPFPENYVLKHVHEQLAASDRWHREHDVIHRLNALAGARPGNLEGVRETYSLYSDETGTHVTIRNRADGHRLFHQELDLFSRIYPEEGRALRARIRESHPDVRFCPWDETECAS